MNKYIDFHASSLDEQRLNRKKFLMRTASKIPMIRKRLGLSQSELGEKMGVSRQSISSMERGQVALTWDSFLALALIIVVNDEDGLKNFFSEDEIKGFIGELRIKTEEDK